MSLPQQTAFDRWRAESLQRDREVRDLQAYLAREGVGDVLPIDQLLMTDARWIFCGAQYDLPPREQWRRMPPTLRLIRDEVKPAVGEVEVLSGFRRPKMNKCIGGASRSNHLRYGALDLRAKARPPLGERNRKLCAVWRGAGARKAMGLGLYPVDRFHIDASGHRSWGWDYSRKTSPCRKMRT